MDVVYNHVGPAGNFLAEFGPYFSDRHQTGWGAGFDFDGPASGEVRRFVLDNALMWLRDYHLDGLRLDAVHAIADHTSPHILEQLATEVEGLGAQLHRVIFVIAESDLNDPRFVRSRDAGGYGFDAAWSDDWHHSLHAVLTGERTGYYEDFGSADLLSKVLRQAWAYDGEWSAHRQKIHGGSVAGIPAHSFVIALQNHDQVGNRATGDRLGALVDEGALKAAAALLLTTPFTPMLFQGEEWAASSPFQYFTDHADPGLGQAVSAGRRREFARSGWDPDSVPDPQDPHTFARSKLLWDELDAPFHHRMFEWYRALIHLRRLLPQGDLAGGGIRVQVDAEMRTVAFDRHGFSVRANFGEKDWVSAIAGGERVLMASDPAIRPDGSYVSVPPSNVVILASGLAID
jgi:maltooligosyltrehalose trehalohydrolase